MTLIRSYEHKIIKELIVTNIYDFIEQFEGAKKYFKETYPEWNDKDTKDILDFVCTDQEAIEECLEADKNYYTLTYDENYEGGTFTIHQIRQPPNYKKAYDILIQYFNSIPDEQKEEVNKQLKEVGL